MLYTFDIICEIDFSGLIINRHQAFSLICLSDTVIFKAVVLLYQNIKKCSIIEKKFFVQISIFTLCAMKILFFNLKTTMPPQFP